MNIFMKTYQQAKAKTQRPVTKATSKNTGVNTNHHEMITPEAFKTNRAMKAITSRAIIA